MKRYFPCAGARALHAPTRREFIYSLGASLGSVAFSSLLAAEKNRNPLPPKLPMLPTKAKACIFLMMEGGPSHIDTFDPKPKCQMNCGNRFGGDPAMGAWVNCGLGSLNADLPGFIVLPEISYPQGGAANWSNGYLPASFQDTPLRAKGSPMLNLAPPAGVTPERQRANLDLLAMTIWLAGGGCNAGHTIGRTDELGMEVAEGKAHIRDLHVTLLRLLGLDDNKLTYYHAGRFKQLSQFGGTVIKGLIA